MQKSLLVLLAMALLPTMLVITLMGMLLMILSSSSAASQPIPPPCTEEKAKEYKAICMDLGVPYDLPLMADFFNTQKYSSSGFKKDIEDTPVILSALQFCYINEAVYHYVVVSHDKDGNPIYDWVLTGYNLYSGASKIIGYIGRSPNDTSITVANVFNEMKAAADAKFLPQSVKYKSHLEAVSEDQYEPILKKYWTALNSEDDISTIIALYQEKYLPQLYGESAVSTDLMNVTLPEITVGSCTRADLALVATSIINWPYELGSKSPHTGRPGGPLDCSGYIDWIYFQCFGKTVGAGTAGQFYRSQEISESELKIGDLGFYYRPEDCGDGKAHDYNHVGIYMGQIKGEPAFIHCGGSWFGTPASPTGRVGISINANGPILNDVNPLGSKFSPPMKSTKFQYFRRPQFQFAGDN